VLSPSTAPHSARLECSGSSQRWRLTRVWRRVRPPKCPIPERGRWTPKWKMAPPRGPTTEEVILRPNGPIRPRRRRSAPPYVLVPRFELLCWRPSRAPVAFAAPPVVLAEPRGSAGVGPVGADPLAKRGAVSDGAPTSQLIALFNFLRGGWGPYRGPTGARGRTRPSLGTGPVGGRRFLGASCGDYWEISGPS
jgi:hypothetical protein